MNTCRQCGATLAENAQYCMQCGTAASPPPASSAQASGEPLVVGRFLGPAFLSGTVMGILAAIPVVNCLCCAWVLGGGGAAAWLVGRDLPRGTTGALGFGDGAFAGVLTGVWGAIVATLASIPFRFLSAEALEEARAEIEALLSQSPEISGPMREMMLSLISPDLSPLAVLLTLMINLLTYSLFAMIGGILFVAIVRRPDRTAG